MITKFKDTSDVMENQTKARIHHRNVEILCRTVIPEHPREFDS